MENIKQKSKETILVQTPVQAPISVELFEGKNIFGLNDSQRIELESEAAKRVRLSETLNTVFSKIGDDSLDCAIEKGLIKQVEADQFSEDLSNFISEDENNSRIILYLPFQVFPDLTKNPTPAKQKLGKAMFDSIIRLLHDSEPRCNFNNGDELEDGMGEPPRTRKVAHLIPQFVEKGIVSVNIVVELMELSEETEMTKAIFEGAVVAYEKGIIPPNEWKHILILAREKDVASLLEGFPKLEDNEAESIDDLRNLHTTRLELINLVYSDESKYARSVSKKRVAWEMGIKIDEATEEVAHKLAAKLSSGESTIKDLEQFEAAGVRGLIRYLELEIKKDSQIGSKLFLDLLPDLKQIKDRAYPNELNELTVGLKHLAKLNAIPNDFMNEMGILSLDLSKQIPIDLNEFATKDGRFLIETAGAIENDSELSKYFYPFFVVFGSRIKGYAENNVDFDIAIFVKPETEFGTRTKIMSRLKEKVPNLAKIDMILEYWVNKKDQNYGLKVAPKHVSSTIIGAPQIHFLFGGVWIGKSPELDKIKKDILSKYLDLSRFGEQKDVVRTKLLRQLEIDVLQYRLMHKGYRKNYPANKEEKLVYGDLIDFGSDFWDQGYREVATQLFLRKVFLPDLS